MPTMPSTSRAAMGVVITGLTEDTTVSGGGMGVVVYSNAEHVVLLAGDGSTVSYTVTPKQ